MTHFKSIFRLLVPCLMVGLSGCYYPAYQPAPAYGYAPPPQGNTAVAPVAEQCREYTKSVKIDGRTQQVDGMACRQPDGSWKDSDNGAIVTLPAPQAVAAPQPYYAPPPQPYYYPAPVYPAPVYAPAYPAVGLGVGIRIH